jgi:sugar phosphate isomerase/epimerase
MWGFCSTLGTSSGGGGHLADIELVDRVPVLEAQINGRHQPAADELYVPMSGRLPPGEGDSPLAEVVCELRRRRPELVLGVEVFTAEAEDPDVVAGRLSVATRGFLANLACP